MVNNINEVIANLAKIDSATSQIMESTKKEQSAYSEEMRQKTIDFDRELDAQVEKKVDEIRKELFESNQKLIDEYMEESTNTHDRLDKLFTEKREEWIDTIFNNIIKE
ncbi:MAG: hypothetical protein E7254_01825 [Lachnospiraceae bacterium]|nr:hypothetical protein [Lachnospiraceae bacterium]